MEWDKNLAYILILSETKHKVYIMNATNNTANVPATPEHKLRDLAAIVVGICAGILVVIIVLTAIIQFQSNIVSFFASLKFRRPEKDVEMREPRKLSINPEAREGSAAPSWIWLV